jgi:hypothetical protein
VQVAAAPLLRTDWHSYSPPNGSRAGSESEGAERLITNDDYLRHFSKKRKSGWQDSEEGKGNKCLRQVKMCRQMTTGTTALKPGLAQIKFYTRAARGKGSFALDVWIAGMANTATVEAQGVSTFNSI